MAPAVGEASSSFPPSASIPPPRRSCTYDVFLSFSGKDARNGITSHLNAALERRGIKTFIDDNDLETGEDISSELLKAIEESMFAITVFSPNYASSSWCLEELHKIVECSKNMGLSIVPVFYGVEPYHVRRQKGSFGEAFKTQEDRFGQNSEKVRRWRDALVQVANVSGFDFKDKQEAKLVEYIAEHIQKKLIKRRPYSTTNLVGINSRVEEVISRLDIGLNGVRSIGIWGMGGIGKTTIAKAVYDAIQGYFEVSCFLYNVREACEEKKIVDLQKKLLTRANISVNTSDDEHDLQKKIQTFLCKRKVLLVLDDVSNVIELKNLAEKQDWFGLGSRIIITTRNTQVLMIYDVHGTYEVQGLVNGDSFDLFCLKAFKPKMPVTTEYLDLSREVVEYSGGLPLALEVWGSHLKGRPIDAWHDAIAEIKSTPFKEIHNTLIISYNGLDDKKKNIFLDIACFFKGKKRDYVTEILKSCGYNNANFVIAILIERSLVMIKEESEVLEMHDLLQDLGRSIVIQESKDNPGKRSRLWSSEDIDLVLEKNKASKDIQVQGIALTGGRRSVEAFSNMTQLKLLILKDSADSLRDHGSLPTSLKVLHCWYCRFKTLLLTDQQYELVDIRLEFGYIENLWHGNMFLGKLKHLRLRCCSGLKQTPDVSKVPMLQTLVLERCESLSEVHPSVVQHKSLTLLDLTGCLALKALPGKLEMSSLKELILDKCSYFENLPEFGECMKSLSRLSLDYTSIKELPTSIGCLVGLEHLSLRNWDKCRSFITNTLKSRKIDINALESVKSPKIVSAGYNGNLPRLRTLNLSDCSFLSEKSFPPNFFHFPSLMDLDLSRTDFVSIPISIHGLPKLKCLKLNNCNKLQCLPELPSSIRELEAFNCDSLDISDFNILSKVRGVFESPSQDPGQVLLEMVIPGSEIPSWFVRQQDGNSISIPCGYPRNERLGIALCFQLTFACPIMRELQYALVVHNGNNRFNINRTIPIYEPCKDDHLYIICLTNDYFSDGFHQGFELSILGFATPKVSMTSAARWVSKEDIEDLKKSEIERPKKK